MIVEPIGLSPLQLFGLRAALHLTNYGLGDLRSPCSPWTSVKTPVSSYPTLRCDVFFPTFVPADNDNLQEKVQRRRPRGEPLSFLQLELTSRTCAVSK